MQKTHYFILMIVCLLLQGCTVAHYKLNNQLSRPSPCDNKGEVAVYHISLAAKPVQYTRDANYTPEQIQQMQSKYAASTQKVFFERGISATETEDKESATFRIYIQANPLYSALPQEFLTGLSLGIIPSWGTREKEFSYSFMKVKDNASHTYTVDQKSYNHLICFPVFWTMFFTLDESRVYEKALNNYLDNTGSSRQ